MDALVQVRNLHKSFPIKKGIFVERTVDQVDAVIDVSFDIGKGETLGLVGESGSGKATTGYCILQIIRPTSGTVVFDGHELTELKGEDLRRLRRRMQLVVQDPFASLVPRGVWGWVYRAPCAPPARPMPGGDMVGEPLVVHKVGSRQERRARVRDLLDAVGFDPGYTHRYPHALSGGQRPP